MHVKFVDKLDYQKSKLVDKFEDLETSYSDSEAKASGDAQHKYKPSEP